MESSEKEFWWPEPAPAKASVIRWMDWIEKRFTSLRGHPAHQRRWVQSRISKDQNRKKLWAEAAKMASQMRWRPPPTA